MPRKTTSKTGEHEAAKAAPGGKRARSRTVEVPALEGAGPPVPSDAVAPPWIPPLRLRLHDRYLLDRWTGLVAGGAIYEAQDTSEGGRPVEVIVFAPALSALAVMGQNRERLERMLAFVNPHLGATFDVATSEGLLFLVAEPRPPETFRAWRATTTVGLSGILKICSHFLQALESVHDAGTFHGALTSASFRVIDGRGVVAPPWWLDAGGATVEGGPEAPWSAPECAVAPARPTHATDLRALALVLGEALLGVPAASAGPCFPALVAGGAVQVGGEVVPAEVGPVLARALEPDPAARFPSVAALRQALETALGPLWAEVGRPATTRFLASLPMRQAGGRPLSALTARIARPTSLLPPVDVARTPTVEGPRVAVAAIDVGADTVEGLAVADAASRATPPVSSQSSTLDFVAPMGGAAVPPSAGPLSPPLSPSVAPTSGLRAVVDDDDDAPPPPPPGDDGTLAGTVAEDQPPWANLPPRPPPPDDPTIAELVVPELRPALQLAKERDTVALRAPPPTSGERPTVVGPAPAAAPSQAAASPVSPLASPPRGLLETEEARRPQVHVQAAIPAPPPDPDPSADPPASRRGLFLGLGLAGAVVVALGLVVLLSGADPVPTSSVDAGRLVPTASDDAMAAAASPIAPDVADVPDTASGQVAAPDTVPNTGVASPDVGPSDAGAVAGGPPDAGLAPTDAVVVAVEPASAPPILDPETVTCPPGMSRLKRKLPPADPGQPATWEVSCIDRLEFPGGGVPTVNVDLGTARGLCAAKKKRLCTRSEWRRGCGGKYPYGADFEQDRCHLVSDSGGGQSPVATGSKTGCRSPLGLADMVGNVAEWTVDGSVNGGSSLKDGENATCDLTSRRAGGAPHIGFRCCADPVR